MYPLPWFLTFLYYTDVASLPAVLATYLACLKKNYLFSGLLGAIAVVIRQTNIIWVLFVACSAVIEITLVKCKYKFDAADIDASVKITGERSLKNIAALGSKLRKRKVRNPTISADTRLMSNRSASKDYMSGLLDEIKTIFLTFLHLKSELLVSFTPFIILLATFIAFIYWNGRSSCSFTTLCTANVFWSVLNSWCCSSLLQSWSSCRYLAFNLEEQAP